MTVSGISVYFKDFDEKYIKDAAKAGARYVFTSLQISEQDYSNLDNQLHRLLEMSKEYGLEIIPDISPLTFEKLKIKKNDYNELKRMGFSSLRLDYGFDNLDLVKKLQKDFLIFLNASIITKTYLSKARKANINLDKIALIYNYYPHADTGLGWESFKKNLLKKEGLHTSAFVFGDLVKRFPIYEGLPTVERHRGMNPYVAAIELLHEAKVDNVFIGDSEATVETLKYINEYLQNHIITIPCNLLSEYKHLYNKEINIRPDQPENITRLLLPRKPNVGIRHNIVRH